MPGGEDRNEVYPIGENRHQGAKPVKVEDDGTLRTWSLQVAQDATGAERPLLVEADRTGRSQLILWETATPGQIRWRAEDTTGEACVSNYGQDEAGTLDPLRTDPNRILWKRNYPGYIQVDPVEIPAADSLLWDVSAAGYTAANLFEVYFNVVNNDAGGAAVTVSVGADIGAAGALAAPEFWLFEWEVPYPGDTGWLGPYLLAGNDDIRGEASVVNDASIHFRIRRIDLAA